MARWICTEPLLHSGEPYMPGDEIELSDREAAELERAGAISAPKPAEPKAQRTRKAEPEE